MDLADISGEGEGMREICKESVQRTIRDCQDFGDYKDIAEFIGNLESLMGHGNVKTDVKTERMTAADAAVGQSFDYFSNLKQ